MENQLFLVHFKKGGNETDSLYGLYYRKILINVNPSSSACKLSHEHTENVSMQRDGKE